jgi:hypothetical protein
MNGLRDKVSDEETYVVGSVAIQANRYVMTIIAASIQELISP